MSVHVLLYWHGQMLHSEVKIKRKWKEERKKEKKEIAIYFTFVVVCYYLICFKYVSLWNLIKFVNILRKHAASKQKGFKKVKKMILLFVKKVL